MNWKDDKRVLDAGGTGMTLVKEDLVSTIAGRNPHPARGDVETVLASVVETINEALARGDRIALTDSGSVSIVERHGEKETEPFSSRERSVSSAIAATLDEINTRIESIL